MTTTTTTRTPRTPRTKQRKSRSYKPTGEVGRRLALASQLQQQITELQVQLDSHKEHLLHHMNTQKLDRIEFGRIVLSRRTRHNWTYSAATERDLMQLSETKKWEQTHGLAIDNPTVYVSMTKGERSAD